MKKLNSWEIVLISLTLAFAAFLAGFFLGGRDAGGVTVNGDKVRVETQHSAPEESPAPETEAEPAQSARPAGKININSADKETLTQLPGIGETIAERIIEYRNSYGPFHNTDELMDVSGIGEGKYGAIKELITIG